MAFVIKKNETFNWPVKIKVPVDGQYKEEILNLKLKKLKESELDALVNKPDGEVDKRCCRELIVGWKDLQDDEGNEISFSPENLEMVLDLYGISTQVLREYHQALTGAVIKN